MNLFRLAGLAILISSPTWAFDSTSPEPNELSYRVLEGLVEGDTTKVFQLKFIGDQVTGWVTGKGSKFAVEVEGVVKNDILELVQRSPLKWDDIDSVHFEFVGKLENYRRDKPLKWTGRCNSLIDGSDFSGSFEFNEVQPAGVMQINLFHFEKIITQVRNTLEDERRSGGMLPQIRNPSAAGEKVNSEIRKEWYRSITGKEPGQELTMDELEDAIPFIFPDLNELNDPIKVDGITNIVNATVVFNSHDLLSVQWYEFNFHGSESWPISNRFRTYDLVSGRELTLDDLLKPGFETRLGEAVSKSYQNWHHAPDRREAVHRNFGKDPFERDRSNFFVTAEGGIGFGYDFMEQPYHSSGFARVPVFRDEIETLLKPNTVLDRLKSP